MTEIERQDIQIIARNSNWSETDISTVLEDKVYNSKKDWQKFLQVFFVSLGVAFTVAGILFFFAYNWADLHKFVKIGIVECLIITLTLVAVFTKIKSIFKNIILAGIAMLVGVLFAVFGQIYQTGANAYDFFLGWTMAVTLWVIVSNFAPLWLIFIVLINVTFELYIEQVSTDLSDSMIFGIFIIINSLFLIGALLLKEYKYKVPNWLIYIVSIAVLTFITFGFFDLIFGRDESYFLSIVIPALILYPLGVYYGLKKHNNFYLSIISFSVIIIMSALMIEGITFRDFSVFLFIGLFVVASITIVIKVLMNLQKKWQNEK